MPNYAWRGRHPDTKDGSGETVRGVSKGLRHLPNPGVVKEVAVATKKALIHSHVTCTVEGCGRGFKVIGPAVSHFKRSHSELDTGKDAWREYVKKD